MIITVFEFQELKTPLHWAADWGTLDCLNALLCGGAVVDMNDQVRHPIETAFAKNTYRSKLAAIIPSARLHDQ